MSRSHFRIRSVEALAPYHLRLTYETGEEMEVDISAPIYRIPLLFPLQDHALFARAVVGEWGLTVTWGRDELELAADNLFARAVEQSGGVSHEMLWNWMHKNGLNLDTAAKALGLSRRMIAYFRSGAKPIPKYVWLACVGWDCSRQQAPKKQRSDPQQTLLLKAG